MSSSSTAVEKSEKSEKKFKKDGTFEPKYLASLTRPELLKLKAEYKGKPLKEGSVDIELSKRLAEFPLGKEPPEELHVGNLRYRDAWKLWHTREFVLSLEKLLYFKMENGARPSESEGFMNLNGCSVAVRQSKKEKYCFKITHPSRKAHRGARMNYDYLILATDSEADMRLWIAAIETAIIFASSTPVSPRDDASKDNSGPVAPDDSESEIVDDVEAAVLAAQNAPSVSGGSSEGKPKKSKKSKSSSTTSASTADQSESITSAEPKRRKKESSNATTSTSPEVASEETGASATSRPVPTTYAPDSFGTSPGTSGGSGGATEELAGESKNLIMHLMKQVRPGMDLSKVVLPTFILEPRSMLEKLTDFMSHSELLMKAPTFSDPLERLLAVVKFYVSAFYIKPEGVKKPYNPIIGETFRCMWEYPDGSRCHYIAEQVSHHPPISSFFAQNRAAGVVIDGSILFGSKFMGTYAASTLNGYASITFTQHGEEYRFTFPDAHAKGFIVGPLVMELVGVVTVSCEQTGYRAELDFKSKPFFGGEYNVVSGKVKRDKETLYQINGHWDDTFTLTDATTKQQTVLWDSTGQTLLTKWKPVLEEMEEKESDRLWAKVGEAIRSGDQQAATDEKFVLEQAQRELHKELKVNNTTWEPRWFEKGADDRYRYKWLEDGKTPFNREVEHKEYESEGRIYSQLNNEKSTGTPSGKTRKRREKKSSSATDSSNVAVSSSTASSSGAALTSSSSARKKKDSSSSPRSSTGSSISKKSTSSSSLSTISARPNEVSDNNDNGSTDAELSATTVSLVRRVTTLEAKVDRLSVQAANQKNAGNANGGGGVLDNKPTILALFVTALYIVSTWNVLSLIFG